MLFWVPSGTEITPDSTEEAEAGDTYSDLSEAFMEHGHQQLGQHDHHHDVVGADDHGAHKRAQLLRVADAGDEESNVRQREDVPEQGVAGPHEPVTHRELLDVHGHLGSISTNLFLSRDEMTDGGWLVRVERIVALPLAEYALAVLWWILVRVLLVLSVKLGESNGEGEQHQQEEAQKLPKLLQHLTHGDLRIHEYMCLVNPVPLHPL